MQRFDKSFQALQSRVAQLEESKRDTVSAPKPDSKPPEGNESGSRRTEFRCYECDELGHIARNCPQRASEQEPACRNEGSTTGLSDPTGASKPPVRGLSNENRCVYLPVRIKPSRLQCTLDTGSDVTVVLMCLVRRFNLKVTNSPTKQLKAANGTGIVIEGASEVPLFVAGQLAKTSALVSKDVFKFIIGSDWLVEHHCNWNFKNSCISVNGGAWIQLNERRPVICGRVYTDTDVVIPPRVQCNVPVWMVVVKPGYVTGDTMLESKCLKPGLYVGRTLVSRTDGYRKTVCLMNVSEDKKFVCGDTCLGDISEVKVLQNDGGSETTNEAPDDNEVVSDLILKLPEELSEQQRETAATLLRRYGDILSSSEYIGRTVHR